MPRPKKQDEQRLAHIVSFRLNEAQMQQLRQQAAHAGLDPGECARIKALGGDASPLPRVAVQDEPPWVSQLVQQMIRVGVNMNQIARGINMTGEHEPQELREASRELQEILRQVVAVIRFR